MNIAMPSATIIRVISVVDRYITVSPYNNRWTCNCPPRLRIGLEKERQVSAVLATHLPVCYAFSLSTE